VSFRSQTAAHINEHSLPELEVPAIMGVAAYHSFELRGSSEVYIVLTDI
jgi:hypothetical protein